MIAIGKGECQAAAPRAADRRPGAGDRRLRPEPARRARVRGRRTRRIPSADGPHRGPDPRDRPAPAGRRGRRLAARRIGLPAVVGYLALGILVSPFTPGYVADHDQLQLLADWASSSSCSRSGSRSTSSGSGPSSAACRRGAAPDHRSRPRSPGPRLLVAGLQPVPAALIGLSVALSSSVVIVNITKSRRRTTDRATEEALLGWSALQDTHRRRDRRGPAGAARLRRAAARPGGVRPGRLPRPDRRGRADPAGRPPRPPLGARPVPDRLGRERVGPGRARVRDVRRPAGPRRVRRRTRRDREPGGRGGAPPAAPFPGPLRGPVLRRDRDPDPARRARPRRSAGSASSCVLIVVAKIAVAYGLARIARLPARPSSSPSASARSASSRSSWARPRPPPGAIAHDVYVALVAAVAVSIAVSTVVARIVGRGRPSRTRSRGPSHRPDRSGARRRVPHADVRPGADRASPRRGCHRSAPINISQPS